MGQYWRPVNLDRREYVEPFKLGAGTKLWEQLAGYPGTGTALVVLTAAMPEPRGSGDFDINRNWHGSERKFPEHGVCPGPMPKDYPAIAKRTIGRWAGDRIAIIGDYAEDGDLPSEFHANSIYEDCDNGKWKDVTDDVAAVIEHELKGRFVGDNWREFIQEK